MSSSLLAASEVSLFDMNSWWWAILKGLYWIVNAIQMAYNYLVGITPVSQIAGEENPNVASDVLFSLFRDSSVQLIFGVFLIFALVIMLIFLGYGFIKANFKNDDQLASRGKMAGKAFSSMLIMLLLPIIVFVVILFVGVFFQFISATMSYAMGGSGGNTEIANVIHRVCLPEGYSTDVANWDISYNLLKEAGINSDYNYILGIITTAILIYVFINICTALVERLIEVIYFYLLGPFTLARAPLDDGNSFNIWKDLLIAKLLAAGGIIISMYLYFILLGQMLVIFDPKPFDNTMVKAAKAMVKIFFTIGGAFAVKKGSLTIAQLISQNTGISEGFSQGQSMHMLSGGLALGTRMIFGGVAKMGQGALLSGRSTASGASNLAQGVLSGGGAKIPSRPGDGKTMTGGMTGLASGATAASSTAKNSTASKAAATGANATAPKIAGNQGGGAANVPLKTGSNAFANGSAQAAQPTDSNFGNASNDVFNNPNAPGVAGKIARRNQHNASARDAMLYGGVVGGIGYGLGKAARGIGNLGKKAAGSIGKGVQHVFGGVKNKAANTESGREKADMRAAKKIGEQDVLTQKQGSRLNKKAQADQNKIFNDKYYKNMSDNVERDFDRITDIRGKIQKDYGNKVSNDSLGRMQEAATRSRMDKIQRKLDHLGNCSYSNNLKERLNKLKQTSEQGAANEKNNT